MRSTPVSAISRSNRCGLSMTDAMLGKRLTGARPLGRFHCPAVNRWSMIGVERYCSRVVRNERRATYFPLFTCRTKRSSKNCDGLAFFASGIVSDKKSSIPCNPGSEVTISRRNPAFL
jgi:hypothetical protein